MSTTPVNPDHGWLIAGIGEDLIHSDTTKRACLDWIAHNHGITGTLSAARYPTGGYVVEAGDTKYLILPHAVAVEQGYKLSPPAPSRPAARAVTTPTPAADAPGVLARGHARAGINAAGTHAFIEWKNLDGVARIQETPLDRVPDLDAWIARMATKLARYNIQLQQN